MPSRPYCRPYSRTYSHPPAPRPVVFVCVLPQHCTFSLRDAKCPRASQASQGRRLVCVVPKHVLSRLISRLVRWATLTRPSHPPHLLHLLHPLHPRHPHQPLRPSLHSPRPRPALAPPLRRCPLVSPWGSSSSTRHSGISVCFSRTATSGRRSHWP